MNGLEQPAAPRRARGCLRDAAIVACVLAALIVVVGAAAYFAFVMTDHTLQQEDLANLTEGEVLSAFADLQLSEPDLSTYAYISDEPLDGPRFDSVSIGPIRYGGMKDGRLTPTTRTADCQVRWQNSYVLVSRPLTAEFEFVNAEEGWKLSIYTLADMKVSPLRPPNVYDLEGDIVSSLRLYDATLGDAFADAHMAVSSDLSIEGGTVKAVLTRELDGETLECTVECAVKWVEGRGWTLEVTSVAPPEGETVLPSAEEEPIVPEPIAPSDGGAAEQRLACHAGDLVTLSGTLAQRDGVFVLETVPTEVTMAGRSWVLSRFVITGPSARLTESLGEQVSVTGYLTAGYALEDAPLSLAVKSLE